MIQYTVGYQRRGNLVRGCDALKRCPVRCITPKIRVKAGTGPLNPLKFRVRARHTRLLSYHASPSRTSKYRGVTLAHFHHSGSIALPEYLIIRDAGISTQSPTLPGLYDGDSVSHL